MYLPRLRYRARHRQLGFETLETRELLAATPIEIFAAGETGEETLELQIDSVTVASFPNVGGDASNRVFQQLSYTHPTDVTADRIRIAFNNNGLSTGGADMNLHVDRIEVNGSTFETEAPSVFSVGTAVFGVGCTSGFIQSETLWCNGYFQYDEPTGSTIEIQAAGWTGEEALDLEIDGNVVASFANVGGDAQNGVFESLSYTHTGPVSIDQVRVAFNNNGVAAGGGDRNLRVDKVTLDGQDFETEAPSVFSVGTAVFGVGCTSGFIQSETLWCNGYFDYSQPTGSSIQAFAAGETGEEQLDLVIDGSTVATFSNVGGDPSNRVFQTLNYTHTTNVTIDQIRVEFNNNGVSSGGGDINLWVDKLVLDGTTFETEADDTFSVGSVLPGLGCTEGTLLTETLYCNGYFEYQNNANPGTLALGTTAVSVNEDDGTVSIPVVRTDGSDGAVSLNYTTVDATATSGEDYIITSGQAILGPGETTTDIVVPIINDTDDEGNETFNVSTDQTTGGATLGFPRTATITILDDDGGPTIGNGNGLLGTYYNDRDLLDFVLDRTDTTVDFDWGSGSPDGSIGNNTFSIVWSGRIEPLYSETYTFEVQVDDGVRLYVDNQLIIDEWQDQNTTHTGQIALQGGIRHDIRIEYYENQGNAQMSFRWSSASQAFEIVPQTQLYSDPPFNLIGSFSGETIVSGLTRPTAIDFAPDGRMFVAQQNGVVRVYENGSLLSQPFIDISARVNNVQDRGLLGLAVHPQFPTQPYVYLLYTYEDPNELAGSGNAGPDGRGNRVARLERITANSATSFNTAASNTGTVILGTNSTWDNISFPDQDSTNNINLPPSCAPDGTLQDCLPADSRSHTIGTVAFGTDGMLYVTNGDGTSFGQVDPRTVRVQDIDSLSGKVLRIDPISGAGLSDNPFYNGTSSDNRSKVYAYGLRNPFRMAIRPVDGEPYISDVGWNTYEEINTGRGQNFGWPFYEGGDGQNLQTGGYNNPNLVPEGPAFYANNNAVPPLWSRSHADGGVAMVAGDFYTGGPYPSVLDNSLFFTDFGDPKIRALVLNADGSFNRQIIIDNSVGATVEMSMGLDGLMYYVDLNGNVGRFVFNSNSSNSNTGGNTGGGSGAAAKGDFDTDGDTDGNDFL
ncbi:MAG: carbohydrate-binding domain-containing protein, partial [Bythopirellula sp.]